MTLSYLRSKTPKIIKNNPVAFGFSVALHFLLLIVLLWEQAPEERQQHILALKKNHANAEKPLEVIQQKKSLEALNTHHTKVKNNRRTGKYKCLSKSC
jgi:hypothetical protein